ncbi:putative late blight resistance protein homolog R1B-17 [Solanum stenotomum]|uniref:putative late blight resistance protein homolog R1B-17 n=1 Tax=Solanum stenotomum TaxID=172797 RepID=UPI0020D07F64|nr:putative late blight resistance protein homolog R1B-17 [Solanum stenotomum]XP_049404124.1 putative late blight resistance protein homolog R1B-17 [Solanum stenotomum]XP_049404125.1 putative late blight resistance protein homolog R1B-17 [Solanum stenotomum]XP_049404126.1 putative late blight resistance protein homolog R1B-17 [Solanum stenotomum]
MENSEESCIEPYYPSIGEELVGFDDDAENITKYLVRGGKDLDVVSIVGMAGLGKTALARKIYNSHSIIDHFDVRAWCSVSQTYNRRELLLQILKQITGDHHSNYVNLDYPEEILRRCLYRKRYLVVLDNIWDGKAWDDFQSCLPDTVCGSRIMITTRDERMASYVKRYTVPYSLPFLKDEKSWELLQKRVFQRGNSCPLELVKLGQLVAKKCKGLPSLIIMIAETLSRETEASSWLKVAYDISSYVSDKEMSMRTIQSSYDLLPDHLKPCLLYMGLFPKDYEIPVSDLLKWWIAEEFVQNIDTLKLEELSEICLHDLVGRNLVVVSKTRSNGKMKCCIVLDQVRDFCLRKITEEKFMQLIGYPDQPEEQRLCMYIQDRTMTSDFKESDQEFMVHPKFSILDSKNPFRLLNNLKLVRVLHLLDIYLDNSLPTAFQSLAHLRYLAIFVKAFDCKWVSHLLHLQTLRVRSSYIMISPAIWKMSKLRHVDINEFPVTVWEKDDEDDIVLDNLKTLGMCSISAADMTCKFWDKFPNLEELRLHINEFEDDYHFCFFPLRLRGKALGSQ